jgi:hypothetical protein
MVVSCTTLITVSVMSFVFVQELSGMFAEKKNEPMIVVQNRTFRNFINF